MCLNSKWKRAVSNNIYKYYKRLIINYKPFVIKIIYINIKSVIIVINSNKICKQGVFLWKNS